MQLTVSEFKAQFPRFTPSYLPVYENKIYFKDDIVYYENAFYQSKKDNNDSLPTVAEDWQLYNDNVLNYTQDSDIMNAINEASINFNEGLFAKCEQKKLVFAYLVAHYLTVDFNNALGNNTVGFLTSRSVGSVSESFAIPQWITNNAGLSVYATTGYGIKYCSLLRPYLIGNVFIVKGGITSDV